METRSNAANPPFSGDRSNFDSAMVAWRSLLGPVRLQADAGTLARYEQSASGDATRSRAVLVPESHQEVQEIARIALQHGIKLYPISTGNNWGYGAGNPVQGDCCIVDLSKLTTIHFVDEDLGLIEVGPGVTQQMLADYLADRDSDLMVPVHGGGPDCSLIGNALERGYGLTPGCDHFDAVHALRVVLADGSEYESPMHAFEAPWLKAHRWGIGPYLDGIFSQGNFGIVTQATIALEKRPEHVEAFFMRISMDQLDAAIDSIRETARSLPGVVIGMNVMNARRVLAMSHPYPKEQVAAGEVMGDNLVAEMARESGIADWMLAGVVHCTSGMVRSVRREITRKMPAKCGRIVFMNHRRLRLATRVSQLPKLGSPLLKRQVSSIEALLDMASGTPRRVALPLAYWLNGKKVDTDTELNPARDGCGLIWFSPLVPVQPDAAKEYVELVEAICRDYGIEPLITLTTLSHRLFDSTVPLLYRKDEPGAQERAQGCYDELLKECSSRGFVPYRVGVRSMPHLASIGQFNAWELSSRLRQSIDPQDLISPGRYSR